LGLNADRQAHLELKVVDGLAEGAFELLQTFYRLSGMFQASSRLPAILKPSLRLPVVLQASSRLPVVI
jgi:hypothetical protein